MRLLRPAMALLANHLDSGRLKGQEPAAVALLARINGNFEEAKELIEAWARKGHWFFSRLHQALRSQRFAGDFERLREELADRIVDLTLYETLSIRIAVDKLAWRAEDEAADVADKALIPAAVAREAEGDGVSLGEMLRESGVDERELRSLMAQHRIAYDEVRLALNAMEQQAEARHRELRSYLKGNALDKPADVIDWADIDLDVGGNGRVVAGARFHCVTLRGGEEECAFRSVPSPFDPC